MLKPKLQDFLDFIRRQGVVGLAVGIILGGAVGKLVSSLVNDVITPIIGVFLGRIGDLHNVTIPLFSTKILIGNFISNLIDFAIISAVVYYGIKKLGLERLDKAKEDPAK